MECGNLTGNYRVRVVRPALAQVRKFLPRSRDAIELRSHALKLRYWPDQSPEDENGQLLDLNWSWITALKGLNIGELRVDDRIGGHENLRIIFFRGDPQVKAPLPLIWIIAAFPKKRMDFTKAQLEIFKSRRTLVLERFYRNREIL